MNNRLNKVSKFLFWCYRRTPFLRSSIKKYNLYKSKNYHDETILGLFTCRAYNSLYSEGVFTVKDIVDRFQFKDDLLMLPNLGKKSMQEIVDVLSDYGIRFW